MNANALSHLFRILFTAGIAGVASAQVVVVDTAADVIDFGGLQRVADLPGPDGRISLAEAALASDNTPGVQTIAFHVPQNEWQNQAFYPGRAVLSPWLGLSLNDTVILDGTTQTAFTGDTNPAGAEVVIGSSIYVNSSVGTLIRGFDSTVISTFGCSGTVIQGNSICGIEVWNSLNALVGGTSPGQGNTGGNIKLIASSNCVVVGNRPLQIRVLGNGPFEPPTMNNRIGGPTLAERNYVTGTGTLNSQFIPSGTAVELFQADGTVIQNNWIGTTVDGLSQGHPRTTIGVLIGDDCNGVDVLDNRIAGIHALATPLSGPSYWVGTGILMNGPGSGVRIQGNAIGLDANDQPSLGAVRGIWTVNHFAGVSQNLVIGGTAPGEGNRIAGHDREGVLLSNAYVGVRISGNSIHDNGALGIDLIDSAFGVGVSPNDPLDGDGGANGLQNFPVLQSASAANGVVTVGGTLNSAPNASFSIEFFASPACHASGFGEGRDFIGATTVATGASGDAVVSAALTASISPGWFITATATDLVSGSTSEFSACTPLTGVAFSTYCTAKVNSQGCTPAIAASGVPSASSGAPFTVSASNVLNRQNGIFFYGYAQQIAPFQGGFKCMSNPVKRTPVQNSAGSPQPTVDCSGVYSIDFNAWVQTGIDPVLAAGVEINGQFWSRDSGSASTTGLTDAVHFVIGA